MKSKAKLKKTMRKIRKQVVLLGGLLEGKDARWWRRVRSAKLFELGAQMTSTGANLLGRLGNEGTCGWSPTKVRFHNADEDATGEHAFYADEPTPTKTEPAGIEAEVVACGVNGCGCRPKQDEPEPIDEQDDLEEDRGVSHP